MRLENWAGEKEGSSARIRSSSNTSWLSIISKSRKNLGSFAFDCESLKYLFSLLLSDLMSVKSVSDRTLDIVIIDTLGYESVKDSLFKNSDRYKTMMNVPDAIEGAKYEMKAGLLDQNGVNIPVFEAFVKKSVLLHDQDKNLVAQENEVVSVDGVNGDAIRVGSMEEVNTNGNWPKTYGDSE